MTLPERFRHEEPPPRGLRGESPVAPGEEFTSHERHLFHRSEARGEDGQIEALLGLKGVLLGGRHRIEELYAVGGEGAVFLTRDTRWAPGDPGGALRVAKIALHPLHRPFALGSRTIRLQREALRLEATYLRMSGSRSMPRYDGYFEFSNPLLDPMRGDAFAEPEPVLLMEKLPGVDLDRWLARTHRSGVPAAQMRRTLDRISVALLQGLVDLYDRGFLFADLRPGNLRILGRPERIVRLLDAGSLVAVGDRTGRFPHVPSYLPIALFRDRCAGQPIVPTPETQGIMAGRTLYEVATGFVPRPGEEVDLAWLRAGNVSPPVAEVIEGLATGSFVHVRHALRYLEKRAQRRVAGANDPLKAAQVPTAPAALPARPAAVVAPAAAAPVVPAPAPAPAPAPIARPFAAPAPTPVPAPAPAAAPAPVPRPEPAPTPARAPMPSPTPIAPPAAVPAALPTPVRAPVPLTFDEPEVAPAPRKVAAQTPAPVPTPLPAPVHGAAPAAIPAPAPAPVPAPIPRTAPASVPSPAPLPAPMPRTTPAPAPAAIPVPVRRPDPAPMPARVAAAAPAPATPPRAPSPRVVPPPVPPPAPARPQRASPPPVVPAPMPSSREIAAHLKFTYDREKTPLMEPLPDAPPVSSPGPSMREAAANLEFSRKRVKTARVPQAAAPNGRRRGNASAPARVPWWRRWTFGFRTSPRPSPQRRR